MPETHVHLHVHGGKGSEPVHAELVGDRRYRVLSSPGFVLGVAAGDEIELSGEDGQFRVLRHGGNLAVQLFSKEPVRGFRESLAAKVRDSLKGVLDGGIDRGLVFYDSNRNWVPRGRGVLRRRCQPDPGNGVDVWECL